MRPRRTSWRTLMGRMLSRRVHMLVEIPVELRGGALELAHCTLSLLFSGLSYASQPGSAGRRSLSEITTFDFVLLLIVREATQQALLRR